MILFYINCTSVSLSVFPMVVLLYGLLTLLKSARAADLTGYHCRFSKSRVFIHMGCYIDIKLYVNNGNYPAGRKIYILSGILNENNKAYLPARMTTLGYDRMEY